jgi:hypothetical protein
MALSADLARKSRPKENGSYKVTNALQIYAGSLVGIDSATGYAVLWGDTATYRFRGVALNKVKGDTAAVNIPEVEVNESGERLIGVSVAGVSSIASVGALVYASDDNTFTLTPGNNAKAIGHVTRWHTGAICDVALFTPDEYYGLL